MTIAVFHGSPRKGNTYFATGILLDELKKLGVADINEFFFPRDLPGFCTGCTLCLGGKTDKCPDSEYVAPVLNAILSSDALVFTTPHFAACDMSGAMKNLFDHLDFLVLNVTPRAEIFGKKAFILTTGAGSTAAIKPIRTFLKHWGTNRVYSLGLRLFTDRWENMPAARQTKFVQKIRRAACAFYKAPKRRPYLSTVFYYHMSKFILKRYVGEGNYPFEYWKEMGFFNRRPF